MLTLCLTCCIVKKTRARIEEGGAREAKRRQSHQKTDVKHEPDDLVCFPGGGFGSEIPGASAKMSCDGLEASASSDEINK